MTRRMAATTSRQQDRTLLASPAVVGLSRDIIATWAIAWGLPEETSDKLVRCTSELVTNAVGISHRSGQIRLRLSRTADSVTLSVWDGSPEEPKSSSPDITLPELDALPDTAGPDELPAFGGWGLPIVEALADRTGTAWVHPAPQQGKWVCATFDF